jgi:hypothetical protein
MALLDWIKKRNEVQREAQSGGWRAVGVYLYNSEGRYPPASWAKTPEEFAGMVPQIRNHLDNKLEIRITNGDDHLLFHATKNGIEWDGIRLSEYLSREAPRHSDTSEGQHEHAGREKEMGMSGEMGIRERLRDEQQEPAQKRDPEMTAFIRHHQKQWLAHNIAVSVIDANRNDRPIWDGEASQQGSEFNCTWQGKVYERKGRECWGYVGKSDRNTYHAGLFVGEGDLAWTTGWGKPLATETQARQAAERMSSDWRSGNDSGLRKQLIIGPRVGEYREKLSKGGKAMPSRNWRTVSWDR